MNAHTRVEERCIRSGLPFLAIIACFVAALPVSGRVPPAERIWIPVPDRRPYSLYSELSDRLRAELPSVRDRMERIRKELQSLDRTALGDIDWAKQWAGHYGFQADGSTNVFRMKLAPQSGISLIYEGCFSISCADHGDVVEHLPDGLRLKLAFGDAHQSYLSDRVYFVTWGSERFLVPDWLLLRFVNNYNQGGRTRREMHGIPRWFPEKDWRTYPPLPTERPKLPKPFGDMLLPDGLRLRVSAVSLLQVEETEHAQTPDCRVEFEQGSDDGVFVGMEIHYPKHREMYQPIRITEVSARGCVGEYSCSGFPQGAPQVGEWISIENAPADSYQPEPATPKDP